jgi:rubrerythrin
MSQNNSNSTKRVAILVEKMVEDSEFQVPHQALKQAGMEVVVLGSRMNEQYPGKQGKVSIKPDATTTEARPEYFDAVIIPGGAAPDMMRTNPNTVRFVKNDITAEWWKLANAWGGSTKGEIVQALNTALAGERYSREAFDNYAQKASTVDARSLFQEIVQNKQHHIQMLEARLDAFSEKPSLQAKAAETIAKINEALKGSDEIALLRRALGDIQTGVVDTYYLRNMLTDPITVALLAEIEVDLAQYEQRVAQIYHSLIGAQPAQAAKPTSAAAMG